ncbi:MAG: A24 family peptidase [Patescibacteria group bacterium]|nr:A24 family peptidase [Patescibacteria group bacterium]
MMLPLAFFMFGAIIASFVGVVVARLSTGEGFLSGRSRCDVCTAPLPPYAMVPILSYLFLGGRAYCCGARISFLAPLTEALLGALFVLAYYKLGLVVTLPFFFLSLALVLALVLYDFAHQILPAPLLIVFVCATALTGFLQASSLGAFYVIVVPAFLIAGSLALIHVLSRGRAMGLADTPFVFGLSLLVGSAALSGFIFSFWIGAVVGVLILFLRPVGSRIGVEVPFAPFLAAGFLLAYFTQWNPFTFIASLSGL